MAFPLTIAKAVFRWTLVNGGEGINVLHFGKFGGGDFLTADCQAVAEALHDWYSNDNFEGETNDAWKNAFDDQQVLQEIVVSDVGPGPSVQYTESVNEAGGVAGTPLAVESAMVSTWRTLTPGRSGRGRTFWPGIDSSALGDDGQLDPTTVTNAQDTLQALIDGMGTTGDYFPTVFSPLHSTGHIITSVTVQAVLHHQKRRNG